MIAEHDAVAPNTLTSAADDLEKVEDHEQAAHEKRNWVRLSYDCNNHCSFCLDTMAHNGTMRANLDIKVQIIEGRKKGAARLILSGGEPTMHPNFLDFVKLGKRAGYPKVQTVTNGRMFAYPDFLETAARNGLDEITFSLHGHTPKLHDALVGTPGAFVEETAGLKAALADGRFIVNVDIVINKQNVKHLPTMLDTFIGWGVKEFDLLHIIPFGSAWGKAREHLFYDLEGNEESLREAFEYSRRPDIHIWLNRFPPPFTEGFEELIQDPHKLHDEVRGRREEYDKYLATGEPLHCRQPERCHYCYLSPLCDTLDAVIEERRLGEVDVLRLEDPAPAPGTLPSAKVVRVVAGSVERALELAKLAKAPALWLELTDYTGLANALAGDGTLGGKHLERCYVSSCEELTRLVEVPGDFTVAVYANKGTADALRRLGSTAPRLIVVQPNYERVTEQRRNDVDVRALLAALPPEVETENIPPCIGGREPLAIGSALDAGMLGLDAKLEMTHFTHRFVADRFYTKSRRCQTCKYDSTCPGVHINFVRAHGYAALEPVVDEEPELEK
ncbi:MAG: radical SAM protein [Sorangiineae bacterium]|nr:radical SAM protein [Polyangiaceae bacterium]MEB2322177.1 radical SAM protein [Sorangiineae bacterium]